MPIILQDPIAALDPTMTIARIQSCALPSFEPDLSRLQAGLVKGYHRVGLSPDFLDRIHTAPSASLTTWWVPGSRIGCRPALTVVGPNHRGFSGVGLDLRDAVRADGWGGRGRIDLRSGIPACIAQGHASIGKVGMEGASFGGFSCWTRIALHADLATAAVPFCSKYKLSTGSNRTECPNSRACRKKMLVARRIRYLTNLTPPRRGGSSP